MAWLGLSSTDEQEFMSRRMTEMNPMHDAQCKANHLKWAQSKENKDRVSELKKGNTNTRGKKWFNDGVKTAMSFECPKGWVPGRLNPHWNHKRKKNVST